MTPITVTITGADDSVDVAQLCELSNRFPFVEWGILFSKKMRGQARYPSLDWLAKLYEGDAPPRMSAHLCGQYARDAVLGNLPWSVSDVDFGRLQINGYEPAAAKKTHQLHKLANGHGMELILQARSADTIEAVISDAHYVRKNAEHVMADASVLYDPSGGRGVELGCEKEWIIPEAHSCRTETDAVKRFPLKVGYAGGIGPTNVEAIVEVLHAAGADGDASWIDMESSVRNVDDARGDYFDLFRVEDVLTKVERFYRRLKGANS